MKFAKLLLSYFLAVCPLVALAQNNTFGAQPLGGMVNKDIPGVITSILTYAMGAIGVVSILFIVYGAFVYITAMGDTKKTDTAKQILTYAVIGLVVAIASFAIVRTVELIFFTSAVPPAEPSPSLKDAI